MTPSDGQAIGHGEHRGVAGVDLRGAEAAGGLRLAGDEEAPELRRLMHPARTTWLVTAVVSLAAVAIVGVLVLGLASATDTVQLAWVTGAVLAVLLVLTWVLCVHAGGHAWLVPVPACILAVAWAYSNICRIYPDGGGVYTAAKQKSRILAVIGALLLFADYTVTASLSVTDGFRYFGLPESESLFSLHSPGMWAIVAIAMRD